MEIRPRVLAAAYKLFPFPLKGDAEIGDGDPSCDVSCVINFYGRVRLLRGILTSLAEQCYNKDKFEVILIEDRGGTDEGNEIAMEFAQRITLRYFTLEEKFGVMGYARNFGLGKAKGKYLLFLDDDTVILDRGFLTKLTQELATGIDAVIPRGSASYCILEGKYSFHDPYFPTNRCMAYSRETLGELGGFVSEIIGQEDVEFVVRLTAANRKVMRSKSVSYMHPPLITGSLNKGAAVGASFAKLKNRYPFVIWLMLLLNGSRYFPKLLCPINTKFRMQGKFSLGFMLGILYSITGRKMEYN
jgi:glycosyltransferase involved in cell wall biosynthesis